MKTALKNLFVMLVAAAVGFGIVHVLFRGGPTLRPKNASIVLEVEVRDTKGRPLKNAEVAVRVPTRHVLGRTNARGILRGKVSVERGSTYSVEARGRNFLEKRTLVAPVEPTGRASVTFDLGKRALAKALKATRTKRRSTTPEASAKTDVLSMGSATGNATGNAMGNATGNAIAGPNARAVDDVDVSRRAAPVRVDVFHGPGSDKRAVAQVADRLRGVALESSEALAEKGVHALQLRQLWNEASYVEIVPVSKEGKALGGYLLRSHKTDSGWLAFALKNMWTRPSRPKAGARTLTVTTSRPSEARAYLNGIPLPRRVTRTGAVFDLSDHPAARAKGAILTLTSDGGPLIRSSVSVGALGRDIRWALPETALSRR